MYIANVISLYVIAQCTMMNDHFGKSSRLCTPLIKKKDIKKHVYIT